MPFSKLGLLESLQRVVADVHYTEPTPIQQQTIPLALEGDDLIAQAQTGTGKTAAFALPILQRLSQVDPDDGPSPVRALVLAPTRELAQQVADTFEEFEQYMPRGIGITAIIGGESIEFQRRHLRNGVQVVVATPGRLLELIREENIDFEELRVLVLDEADRLLALGFAEELAQLMEVLPTERQTLLFSATYPKKVEKLAAEILQNPVRVNAVGDVPTVGNITQRAIEVNAPPATSPPSSSVTA